MREKLWLCYLIRSLLLRIHCAFQWFTTVGKTNLTLTFYLFPCLTFTYRSTLIKTLQLKHGCTKLYWTFDYEAFYVWTFLKILFFITNYCTYSKSITCLSATWKILCYEVFKFLPEQPFTDSSLRLTLPCDAYAAQPCKLTHWLLYGSQPVIIGWRIQKSKEKK